LPEDKSASVFYSTTIRAWGKKKFKSEIDIHISTPAYLYKTLLESPHAQAKSLLELAIPIKEIDFLV